MSDDSEKIAGMAIMSMARDIDEKDAEIQRLRGELDALHTHFDIKAKLGVEKDAEIERLREANIRHNAWFQEEVERRAAAERKQHAAEAEIERLRLEARQASASWAEDKREDAAEIKQLRDALQPIPGRRCTTGWMRWRWSASCIPSGFPATWARSARSRSSAP